MSSVRIGASFCVGLQICQHIIHTKKNLLRVRALKFWKTRTRTYDASRLSSVFERHTSAALMVSPPPSRRNFPQTSMLWAETWRVMIVRVVLYRVTNAAMIFERMPAEMVGFFWRGKQRTVEGSIDIHFIRLVSKRVSMYKNTYIHQMQTLVNSLLFVEEALVLSRHCNGFWFGQVVQLL